MASPSFRQSGHLVIAGALAEVALMAIVVVAMGSVVPPWALLLLLAPMLAIAVGFYMARSRGEGDRACLFLAAVWFLLSANFAIFFFYFWMMPAFS